jgi:hypothetical protein
VAGSCEHSDELLGSIKYWEILCVTEQLAASQGLSSMELMSEMAAFSQWYWFHSIPWQNTCSNSLLHHLNSLHLDAVRPVNQMHNKGY